MKPENLFLNRAFVFTSSNKASDDELDFLAKIFAKIDSRIKVDGARSLGGCPNYDVFEVDCSCGEIQTTLIVKYSLDIDDKVLTNEAHTIAKLPDLISPTFFDFRKLKIGENLIVLIYRKYKGSETVRELGRGILITHKDIFCATHVLFSQLTALILPSLQDRLNDVVALSNIEQYFLEDSLTSLRAYTDFNKLEDLLTRLRDFILRFDISLLDSKDLNCHGNLGLDSIYARNEWFKFSEWGFAHKGHPFLDLARLILNLGLDPKAEKNLFKTYCKYLEIDINEAQPIYDQAMSLSSAVYLLELITTYLQQVYLLGDAKSIIITLNEQLIQNHDRFMKNPIYNDHNKFLLLTITEPILGIKAS